MGYNLLGGAGVIHGYKHGNKQKLGSKPSGNLQYVYPLVVEINMFQLANHLRIGEPILDYSSRVEPTKKRIYLRHDEPKKGMPVEAKKMPTVGADLRNIYCG